MMTRLAAVTGATGFLGRYIVRALAVAGWRVRILARRSASHPQLAGLGIEAVSGDLSDRKALHALLAGADAVVHAAGLIKAPSAAAFHAVNVAGTANLAAAIIDVAAAARVILVSSMAAREPQLSAYARTKRAGEEVLTAALGRHTAWTVVRPSAIYGPWDEETLAVFRAIGRRIALRPRVANAHVALIHASDAAAAIAALADRGPAGTILELADERTEGYSWEEIIAAAATALGVEAIAIPLPGILIRAGAAINVAASWVLRRTPMLTPGKAREILHADWGSTAERQPPGDLWRPAIALSRGLRDTVSWYRERRLLPLAA
ncbi:MAG: NAD-dependent epimerase/dehydratase family protein [Acetobacteraceae bacterium]